MEEDGLTPQAIIEDLNTNFIGQKVVYYPVLDSTMEAAKKEAVWGAAAGTVILTDEQTAGRGRLQRNWLSPKGCLAFSVILRPNLDYLPQIIMLSSLAVTYSIKNITDLNAQIKWPNDILVNGKKICGILIENDIRNNSLRHTIIGIGINVNVHIHDHPEISGIATSLSDLLGESVSRLDILRQILIEMDNLYKLLPKKDLILEQWKSHLLTLGQSVKINMGDKIYHGIAESVTSDGCLMLKQKNGQLIKILAGDVSSK